MYRTKVFFDNKRGVRVTSRTFSTRHKDEDLISIVSVRIGREALYLSGVTGLALGIFAFQFGDLLYADEQMGLLLICALLLSAGYSVASLTIGSLFNEKTAWWYDYWTIRKVRRAIRDAKDTGLLDGQLKRAPNRY